MTTTLCLNSKRLSQGFGYSAWGLLTIGMIVMLIATSYEIPTLYEKDMGTGFNSDNEICYESIFDGEVCTPMLEYLYYTPKLWKVNAGMWVFLVIDLVAIGMWIYWKQTKFKVALCNRTEIRKSDTKEGERQ